jgi:GNAT superfamily N-acetyltransferase
VVVDTDFIRRHSTEVALPDGTRIRLRPVTPDDKQLLVDGFERMTPESRYRRFMSPIQELSPELLAYLTEIDYDHHFAWAALTLDEPGPPVAGVARYVRLPDEPEVAEAAVTVIDDYHGRGLGSLLLNALGAVALEKGVRRFRGYVLEDNRPMRELIEEMGAHVEHDGPGVVRFEVDLPRRADELRTSPLYELLRAAARGEGPVFLRPGRLSPPS